MLKKLFGHKKLPHILSGFQKTLGELESLQTRNGTLIEVHGENIAYSIQRRDELAQERRQAEIIHGNIKKLLEAA